VERHAVDGADDTLFERKLRVNVVELE